MISPHEYFDLSMAIWNIIQTDVFIPEEVSTTLECLARNSEISIGKGKVEGLCLFLATALKYAILRETLIRNTPNLSPRVAFVIKELKRDKQESEFLKALVYDMFTELEKQKTRVGDKLALDTVNHTKYTDDDFVELMAAIAPLQDIFQMSSCITLHYYKYLLLELSPIEFHQWLLRRGIIVYSQSFVYLQHLILYFRLPLSRHNTWTHPVENQFDTQ